MKFEFINFLDIKKYSEKKEVIYLFLFLYLKYIFYFLVVFGLNKLVLFVYIRFYNNLC